jgi:hypothetical protein
MYSLEFLDNGLKLIQELSFHMSIQFLMNSQVITQIIK